MRKRSQLVQQRTANILSVQNLFARNLGHTPSGNEVKRLQAQRVEQLLGDEFRALAVNSNLTVMRALDEQIKVLEQKVKAEIRLKPQFQQLLTVNGIGDILGLTIMLETDIRIPELTRTLCVQHEVDLSPPPRKQEVG